MQLKVLLAKFARQINLTYLKFKSQIDLQKILVSAPILFVVKLSNHLYLAIFF